MSNERLKYKEWEHKVTHPSPRRPRQPDDGVWWWIIMLVMCALSAALYNYLNR